MAISNKIMGMCLLIFCSAASTHPITMQRVMPVLNVQIIGGQPADPAVWPVTLAFRNKDGAGCTSTVIGERVILTAAHCVGNGEVATAQLGPQGSVSIQCDHHPAYPADISADFALCYTSANLELSSKYEVINKDLMLHAVGRNVVLLGYGCLTVGGADRNFGQLFEGSAKVQNSENNAYVVTAGASAVCFGDSGGAAYSDDPIRRRVIAVNSRGDISRYSWLSVTSSALFLNWAREWRKADGTSICGIHPAAKNCHQ